MQTLDVYKKEEGKIWQRKPSPSPEEGYVYVYVLVCQASNLTNLSKHTLYIIIKLKLIFSSFRCSSLLTAAYSDSFFQ